MKFKFSATIVVQLSGEAEGQGDNLAIVTEPGIRLIPAIMFDNAAEIDGLDDQDRKLLMGIITHNVLHRAVLAARLPGIAHGVPEGITDAPEGERN